MRLVNPFLVFRRAREQRDRRVAQEALDQCPAGLAHVRTTFGNIYLRTLYLRTAGSAGDISQNKLLISYIYIHPERFMGKSCARAQFLMSLPAGLVRTCCAQKTDTNRAILDEHNAPSFGVDLM